MSGERDNRPLLNDFDLAVYQTYLEIKGQEVGVTPNNRTMADILTERLGHKVSRVGVAKARRRIAQKMGFKPGW